MVTFCIVNGTSPIELRAAEGSFAASIDSIVFAYKATSDLVPMHLSDMPGPSRQRHTAQHTTLVLAVF